MEQSLSESGWCWEGQGLDPGVYPSVLGVGDGARYFGLHKARFLYHPTTSLALEHMKDLREVCVDISKWVHDDNRPDIHGRVTGSRSVVLSDIDTVCREAETVSRFSTRFPNVTGAIHDDMLGLLRREKITPEAYAPVPDALHSVNPHLRLHAVIYTHELDAPAWTDLRRYIDEASLWVWTGAGDLETDIPKCRERLPDIPLTVGVYLRDYSKGIPQPMDLLKQRMEEIVTYLERGWITGFEILGTILIEGHLEQAEWVRQFIADHSAG